MNILLIDNYDSFTYNIVELLRQCGVNNITIVTNDEVTVEKASAFSHIIISPGPAIPSQSGAVLEIIKALYKTHVILGICLGHQAIAEAFGGTLINFDMPKHGYSTTLHTIPNKLFEHLPQTFQVGLYHSWYVSSEHWPSELEVTAYDDDGIIMSLKHIQYKVYGIQFHPESYMTAYGKEMMMNWLSIV